MEKYLKQIFELLPEALRPEKRKKFKAYDGTNNICARDFYDGVCSP